MLTIEFQAMVHELLGIKDNKVDLRGIPKVPKDQQVSVGFQAFKSDSLKFWSPIEVSICRSHWINLCFLFCCCSRKLCCPQNKIPSLKLICMKILETLAWTLKKWWMSFSRRPRAIKISRQLVLYSTLRKIVGFPGWLAPNRIMKDWYGKPGFLTIYCAGLIQE